MHDRFYKPINMIDYSTLNKLSKGLFPLSMLGLIVSFGLGNFYLFCLGVLAEYIDIYLTSNEAVYHIKELKELNILYKEFLNNYHKLNQIFDLVNPLEIMLLYTFLLDKGYLSKDKKHNFGSEGDKRAFLMRYGVFTGNSVCRHDGILLRDILKEENIKSCILFNYATELRLDYRRLKEMPEFREKLEALEQCMDMASEEFKEKVERLVGDWDFDNFSDETFILKDFSKYITNHIITMAKYQNKSYFMDATNNNILRKRQIEGHLVLTSEYAACVPNTTFSRKNYYEGNLDSIFKAKRILRGDDITRDEEEASREKIDSLTEGNMDILEKFYKDNQELYSDITEEFRRVKARFIK